MRVMVTGQVGMEKKAFLREVVQIGREAGDAIALYNVGDRMYEEAPDVAPGRILDLPLSRLHTLRRSAFKDIINQSRDQQHVLINTHATFRWRHGLFSAFDFDQTRELGVQALVCLVDNIEVVHRRLLAEHQVDATLKDLMAWREEEIMATELLAQALGCPRKFYVTARGRLRTTAPMVHRLVCRPEMRKVYPSFPMTHVAQMPEVLAEIDAFRDELAKHFITFDPGDVDEKLLLEAALAAAREGKDFIPGRGLTADGREETFNVPVKQVLDIAGDIDGQIYARDFKLVDQSDMIVSFIPELPGGLPGLSSGVERELHHAHEHGKEVYVVWKAKRSPSPFVTETATAVFRSVEEAMGQFRKKKLI
ncbi:MAG: AAA family ATPase [Phycisphaeraceae bacterium]|nr:AAA family ATPase [Phycisphaeraceae bacterium]